MLRNYLIIALRNAYLHRLSTFLNLTGLIVGMASGLLIFLFLRHHLSTDHHHAAFERIYRITTDLHLDDGSVEYYPEAPLPLTRQLRSQFPQVEKAAFFIENREMTVTVGQEERGSPARFLEHNTTALVDADFFSIFDYQWLEGNSSTALTEPNGVVLTQSWARKYFGNQPAIGQVLNLDHLTDVRVTGIVADPILPTDIHTQVFISLATLKSLKPSYGENDWYLLNSTNRLYLSMKDARSAATLEAALPAVSRQHYRADAHIFQFHVQPLAEWHFDVQRGGAIRASMCWSLGLVGGLLIVMACINFVNLSTAQAMRRRKEVGIRKTLGSTRVQLVRQFMLETSLIVVIAALLACALVGWTLPVFSQWTNTPLAFRFDPGLLAFVALLLITVIGLAGSYPAGVLSGFSPWQALRGKPAGQQRYSLRQVLVVGQFVIAQVLLLGALVVSAQIRFMQQTDLGFRKENIVVVKLPNQSASSREAFGNALRGFPDLLSVSASFQLPSGAGMYGGSFRLGDKADWEDFPIRERLADAQYLETYGLQLVAGRNLAPSDTIREYLVNEALLKKLHIDDPEAILGKKIQYYLSPVPLPIVGVVKDFHLGSLHGEIPPCLIASKSDLYQQVSIRIAGSNPAQSVRHIREAWQQSYPHEVFEYNFFDEQLARFYDTENLIARLVNTFAAIAILIGCLGLYGLVTLVVGQRRKEMSIRKVLGATIPHLVGLLSGGLLKLVLLANAVAWPLAYLVMNRWLRDFAYRISMGWQMFALAGGALLVIAMLTVSYQAIKAALANPVNALRNE